jgi:flagellar motor switch protein FliN/FliY
MDEMQISALGEIMNQMMGASSTALATFLNRSINISPPESFEMGESAERFAWMREQAFIVTVGFRFVVEDLLDSEFITVMPVEFTKDLVQSAMMMDDGAGDVPSPQVSAPQSGGGPVTGHRQVPSPMYGNDFPESALSAEPPRPSPPPPPPPSPHPAPSYEAPPERRQRGSVDVTPLRFASLDGGGELDADQVNLDLVMDIDLNVVIEIGRVKKLVKEIVALRQGSIVELEKQAGEPVDIMVNGKLIARGDVVVIDDNFGVRITEIVGSLAKP